MKSNQFFSGIALVGLAASVTAGSMYVSLSASSQQETPVGAEDVVPNVENPTTSETVVEAVAKSINQPLAPEQVIHSRSHDVVLDASGAFFGEIVHNYLWCRVHCGLGNCSESDSGWG